MTAEQHLAELKKISTATLKAANIAARNEGLSLVDAARLARLEALHVAVAAAFCDAKMTRSYRDALEDGDEYDGKRYLIDREKGCAIFRELSNLRTKNLPAGCLAYVDWREK